MRSIIYCKSLIINAERFYNASCVTLAASAAKMCETRGWNRRLIRNTHEWFGTNNFVYNFSRSTQATPSEGGGPKNTVEVEINNVNNSLVKGEAAYYIVFQIATFNDALLGTHHGRLTQTPKMDTDHSHLNFVTKLIKHCLLAPKLTFKQTNLIDL